MDPAPTLEEFNEWARLKWEEDAIKEKEEEMKRKKEAEEEKK